MTKESQRRLILSLWIFLLLFFCSCSWLKEEQGQKRTDYADKLAQTELDDGNYQRAIDVSKKIYQKYPQDPNVRNGYIKTLESIKRRGDQAFERNDFRLAEEIYDALARNWVDFSDFSQSLSFRKDFLEKKVKTARCLFTEELVSSYLKAGEFRRAIDLCKEMCKKYPQDPAVRKCYLRTLESIKTSGDRAFEGSDFAQAGYVYEIVLRNISSVNHLNGSLSFSREGLAEKIRNCEKILFENGLEQYRSGNLNQAILLWKSILTFDPENREIKKAVDMATVQFSNLQKAK